MPTLYIANPTRQVRKFYFRLDMGSEGVAMDKTPAKNMTIQPGRQQRMDLKHVSQVEMIVQQLATIGARAYTEKNRVAGQVVPLIFSTDKPVPGAVIEEIHATNKRSLQERSSKRREAMAIVSSQQVQEAVDATMSKFNVDGNVEVKTFEASVEMVDEGQGGLEGKPVAEGLRVNQSATPKRGPARSTKRS